MNCKKWKTFISVVLVFVMISGVLPMPEVTLLVANAEASEKAYDFNIEGSTISFLDKEGNLLTEEAGWSEGENVVHTWHVFMYRETRENLKLGYSTEGKLFLPHTVYEGETADLLYVKDNNMFRVTASKEENQIFDGSKILKSVILKATDGTVTLANAPVYAETPFSFVHMGTTDANGELPINATCGAFKLWVASNEGYILNKSITILEDTIEINFADEIANAVEVDIAGRGEADNKGPGYVVAIGKANETDEANMLTTSYISPEKTVKVTPGKYRVACGVFVEDQNSKQISYCGLWVDLANSAEISEKTTFDFSIKNFEGKFVVDKDEVYNVGEYMSCNIYAEDENGYVIPGRAESPYYLQGRVVVVADDKEYPYTFVWDEFSMLYDAYIYSKDNESEVVFRRSDTNEAFELPYTLFDTTEKTYIIKYYPEYDSLTFPDLFPSGEYYAASFKTQALSKDTYRRLETAEYYSYVYYIDENGKQQDAKCYFGPDAYYYTFPSTVQNGDAIVFVKENWGERKIDYNIVTVNNELFDKPYEFKTHSEFSSVNFRVKNGTEETSHQVSYSTSVVLGDEKLCILDYESDMKIPYGKYVLNVIAKNETYDEETGETLNVDLISHENIYTISEESHDFNVDCSEYKAFGIDTSAFYSKNYWPMDNIMKQFALHFADGSVRYLDWNTVPLTIHTEMLPEYIDGEMYYEHVQEMYPFSSYVSVEKIAIEEGQNYKFDFKPSAIEVTGSGQFGNKKNTVLTYKVVDGLGAELNDIWNLLNPQATHRPLMQKEYPFRDANRDPADHQYAVDVYYRLKGSSAYTKKTTANFKEVDLGVLAEGEYEGYMEIDFDVYCEEYLVEYPMEKGICYDEYWGEFNSVYDNVDRVFHGVLKDEFAFTVSEEYNEPEQPSVEIGDVTGDGGLDTSDAQLIFNIFMGITPVEDEALLKIADITGDGNVDTSDAQKVFNLFMGII